MSAIFFKNYIRYISANSISSEFVSKVCFVKKQGCCFCRFFSFLCQRSYIVQGQISLLLCQDMNRGLRVRSVKLENRANVIITGKNKNTRLENQSRPRNFGQYNYRFLYKKNCVLFSKKGRQSVMVFIKRKIDRTMVKNYEV